MKEFTSTARKDGRWWVVQCDQEPGALSQVARLDQAAEQQREAIAFVSGLDEDEVHVEVRPELDHDVSELLSVAELHRYEADMHARQAHAELRRAVIKLVDASYSLRDIGAILGVSHQRAHQLVQEATEQLVVPDHVPTSDRDAVASTRSSSSSKLRA